MAQITINIGTVANDGTGDTLRGAFANTNNNFTELYSHNTNVVSNLVSVAIGANAWSNSLSTAGRVFANGTANSANAYADTVGAASNTYADTVGLAGNNYSIQVGAAANTWSNSTFYTIANGSSAFNHTNAAFNKANSAWEYANTVNTYVTLRGPYDDDAAANTGGVAVMGLYYNTSGNVRIRLV